MKTLLLDLDPRVLTDKRIDCALDIARAFGSHVTGLQATPIAAYAGFDGFGGVFTMVGIMDAVMSGEAAIRDAFETRMAHEGVPYDFRHSDGWPSVAVAQHSRLADLVIVGKPGREKSDRKEKTAHIGELVVSSSAPVLAIPPEVSSFEPFGPAIVAWNGSPEAAAALRLAVPLLTLASEVTILQAAEPDGRYDLPGTEAAEYLSRHGVRPVLESLPVDRADVAATLLWTVAERGPAYLVMGAYGHSRAREWLLGGVTRELLCELPTPLFMAH